MNEEQTQTYASMDERQFGRIRNLMQACLEEKEEEQLALLFQIFRQFQEDYSELNGLENSSLRVELGRSEFVIFDQSDARLVVVPFQYSQLEGAITWMLKLDCQRFLIQSDRDLNFNYRQLISLIYRVFSKLDSLFHFTTKPLSVS